MQNGVADDLKIIRYDHLRGHFYLLCVLYVLCEKKHRVHRGKNLVTEKR